MLNIIFIANETYFNDIEPRDIFYLKTISNGSYCYCVKKKQNQTPKTPETLKIELNNNWGVSFFDVHWILRSKRNNKVPQGWHVIRDTLWGVLETPACVFSNTVVAVAETIPNCPDTALDQFPAARKLHRPPLHRDYLQYFLSDKP